MWGYPCFFCARVSDSTLFLQHYPAACTPHPHFHIFHRSSVDAGIDAIMCDITLWVLSFYLYMLSMPLPICPWEQSVSIIVFCWLLLHSYCSVMFPRLPTHILCYFGGLFMCGVCQSLLIVYRCRGMFELCGWMVLLWGLVCASVPIWILGKWWK